MTYVASVWDCFQFSMHLHLEKLFMIEYVNKMITCVPRCIVWYLHLM